MIRRVGLLLIFTTILCCSNPRNKSISQPLELEELNTIIEKDTLFKLYYSYLREGFDEMEIVKQAEYLNITYSDIIDFTSYELSKGDKIRDELKDSWQNEYGIYDSKIDSIIDISSTNLEDEDHRERLFKAKMIKMKKDTDGYKYMNPSDDYRDLFNADYVTKEKYIRSEYRKKIEPKYSKIIELFDLMN
jgi:hypothetical protein